MRLYTAQEWQDRIWEWTPANERPLFPPVASSSLPLTSRRLPIAKAAGKTPGRTVASTPPGAAGRAYPNSDSQD